MQPPREECIPERIQSPYCKADRRQAEEHNCLTSDIMRLYMPLPIAWKDE